jgi:hypothetical protein
MPAEGKRFKRVRAGWVVKLPLIRGAGADPRADSVSFGLIIPGGRKNVTLGALPLSGGRLGSQRFRSTAFAQPMTTKPSAPAAAKKKLLSRIAAAQRQADAARKTAKLAKLGYRAAKQKFKDAKRAARKLRKALKSLKVELAALAAKKKSPVRKTATKPVVKRSKPAIKPAPTPAPASAPVDAPLLPEAPPSSSV